MNRRRLLLAGAAWPALALDAAGPARWPFSTLDGERPLVIAHRGASGERPEHTLPAYARAIEQGADYIEPDLVITRDGHLVARHDNELSLTTDVEAHPPFAARRRTQTVDGRSWTGWFVEDFTLAELRQLRARERWPQLRPASAAFDGLFAIPTLGEILQLVRENETALGRRIGVYPETKHAAHFARLGLPLEPVLVRQLHGAGYRDAAAAALLQSFEPTSLQRLALLSPLRRVQVVAERGAPADADTPGSVRAFADLLAPGGFARIAEWAQGIAPAKGLVIGRDRQGRLARPTDLVARAHNAGLMVHCWTFRDEDRFLPADLAGDPQAEVARFLQAGVDGVFTDFPATAVAAVRSQWGR